jgi:hypothetical protein
VFTNITFEKRKKPSSLRSHSILFDPCAEAQHSLILSYRCLASHQVDRVSHVRKLNGYLFKHLTEKKVWFQIMRQLAMEMYGSPSAQLCLEDAFQLLLGLTYRVRRHVDLFVRSNDKRLHDNSNTFSLE